MKSTKKIIFSLILIFLSIYLSGFITNIISPKVQLFIDLENINNDNPFILIGDYNKKVSEVYESSKNSNVFNYSSEIYNKKIDIDITTYKNSIDNVKINGNDFNKIIKISKYTKNEHFKNVYCLKTNFVSNNHYKIQIVLLLFMIFIDVLIIKTKRKKELKLSKFIYSKSSIRIIGKKPIIISIIVTIISLIFYAGCDLNVISESIIMHQKGIDFYQLFATFKEYKNLTLLMWQYDGAMLAGYSLPSYITYPFLKTFNPANYHWIQVFFYKFFNLLLCNMLVLSVISFLIDKKIINKSKTKIIYYLSIFNPVTYYVAMIFIQFDMLPAYLLTLGILLMDNLEENKYLSGILIGYAISCKMTMWLFIPSIAMLCLFIFLKKKNYISSIKHCITIFITSCLLLIIPRMLNTPSAVTLSKLDQSRRIWFTTLPYASNVFLFIAIFLIMFSFIIIYYDISLRLKVHQMILITFVSFSAITLAFSFSTMSTPSFWIQTLSGFMIIYALTDDNLSLFNIFIFSSLMIVQYACLQEGDISAFSRFIGKKSLFDSIEQHMVQTGEAVKYRSFLFTISQTIMFAYMCISYKFINAIKKTNNSLNNV